MTLPPSPFSDEKLAEVWDAAVAAHTERSSVTGHLLVSYHFGHKALVRYALEQIREECEKSTGINTPGEHAVRDMIRIRIQKRIDEMEV